MPGLAKESAGMDSGDNLSRFTDQVVYPASGTSYQKRSAYGLGDKVIRIESSTIPPTMPYIVRTIRGYYRAHRHRWSYLNMAMVVCLKH
jgi:hypothetical protein